MDPGPLPYQGLVKHNVPKDKDVIEIDNELWRNYESYLSSVMNSHTASCRLSYCKKYAYVLVGGDAKDILALSADKRIHVMKSLATLSKYLGCYDKWNKIRQRYQLKWSNGDNLSTFSSILHSKANYTNMVAWLKNAFSSLPSEYGNILLFCTLTGLRPAEACHSLQLIHTDKDNYLNSENMTLEHFKYPNKFIRRTKQAYVSIVTDSLLEIARRSGCYSYNAIRLMARRNAIEMRMSYCRKIFATYLKINGVESEIIDLLQGRIPKSVFVRHYYRPDPTNDRIRNILEALLKEIAN